ncbi:branched-chain amino acid ABC transporter permease [Eoetvoesiella caeni]|uniref:Amino acid/amide ABC transporter membrane protein 1 (HAAT family) n=1 Tax=Eoetvoesiella caeni TaxID=645616 RepID=A0A366HKV2_9BURK|nr:branched-chain amino acid ABC transporter permease [Eoetvoesiella caeni]MCI2807640.1 branched-chain amino acid ABC transporter permease [Eoetvoesiella caeni]NYT52965.1 branched-chain amino acid ABC transporter permease [Eoetvoesiella caeni]RBP42942.1 amino acid/amide ABC transporter membrane protein 1 (HAAT family) [Eoetvoesiella caeni]
MDSSLLADLVLNGLQFGLMLFLLAAGLTLVFGIMDFINLAHGSLYMIGAYFTASFTLLTGSFWLGLLLSVAATVVVGIVLEVLVFRRLYHRNHMSQVLATFALILIFNESARLIWGEQPLRLSTPDILSQPIQLWSGFDYSSFRLFIIGTGLAVAALLYFIVTKTRIGMLVRAGASNREMATAMGANIKLIFTSLFAVGAALCAIAGALLGSILSVQVGMGESILILAFVVIVVGGIGSIRGALIGSLLVGGVDTISRTVLPPLFRSFMSPEAASNLGPALASILIYVLMAGVLFFKPEGLFPARS